MPLDVIGYWYPDGSVDYCRWVCLATEKSIVQNRVQKFNFNEVLGSIVRNKDGSWNCFSGDRFISNEPNRRYAMKFINNHILSGIGN